MMRFIIPAVLVGIAVSVFFVFANPIYNDISILRAKADSYDEALNNSLALENERDKLTAKYNSFNPENLTKLQKLLPENIDNIRLILEIEKLASPYGMVLKDVKYSTATDKESAKNNPGGTGIIQAGGLVQPSNKDYGAWDLGFSTTGSYNNFINFTKDLESNLRIVDISSIQFSSPGDARISQIPGSSSEVYKFDFKIKTYWLKN